MDKKSMVFLVILMILLVACIGLMGLSLLIGERTFGQISGYIAIACIVLTLIGVVIVIRSNHKHNGQ